MSLLFTRCLKFNCLHKLPINVIVKPTNKSKTKRVPDKGNIRPMSIATAASKLQEMLFRTGVTDCLRTTLNQLEFKPQHGTEIAKFS